MNSHRLAIDTRKCGNIYKVKKQLTQCYQTPPPQYCMCSLKPDNVKVKTYDPKAVCPTCATVTSLLRQRNMLIRAARCKCKKHTPYSLANLEHAPKPCLKEKNVQKQFEVLRFEKENVTNKDDEIERKMKRRYVTMSTSSFVSEFNKVIPDYLAHRGLVKHQRDEKKQFFERMGSCDVGLFIDFAESFKWMPVGATAAEYQSRKDCCHILVIIVAWKEKHDIVYHTRYVLAPGDTSKDW
eukprot:gene24284-10329_t